MRNLTLGLLALRLAFASPVATAGGPPVVTPPGVGLLGLILDWLGTANMGPVLEPGG